MTTYREGLITKARINEWRDTWRIQYGYSNSPMVLKLANDELDALCDLAILALAKQQPADDTQEMVVHYVEGLLADGVFEVRLGPDHDDPWMTWPEGWKAPAVGTRVTVRLPKIVALAEQEDQRGEQLSQQDTSGNHGNTRSPHQQRGAAASSRVGSTPVDAIRLDHSHGVDRAAQSAPHPDPAGQEVALPADARDPIASAVESVSPALPGPDSVSVPDARAVELAKSFLSGKVDVFYSHDAGHLSREILRLAAERKEEGND